MWGVSGTIRLMPKPVAVPVPAPALEAAAEAVMRDLRDALAALQAKLPGRVTRPVDVERALAINKKLAWQVFRIAHAQTLADIANVPTAASLRTLLAAGRKKRISAEVLERIEKAFQRFEDFAASQADDRAGLVTLLSGLAAGPGEAYEIGVRKAAFRANAHLWGTKVEMQTRTVVSFPRPAPAQSEDVALLLADIGLQRLRESDPLSMVRWFRTGDSPMNLVDGGAGGGAGAPAPRVEHQVDLLEEFCTRPLPRMVPRASVLSGVETELVIPAGRAGAVTIYSSQVHENAEATPHAFYDGRLFVTIPVETAVWELLVPAGLTDPATARFVVYGRRPHPEHVYDERRVDLLPQRETVNYLGAVERVPPIQGAPRHPEAVRHVLEKHGWTGTRFDLYRCRIQYPVLHTLLCIRVDAVRR